MPPKITLFSNLFPTPQDPERGVFIQQFAEALAQQVDLQVICPLPLNPHLPFTHNRHPELSGIPTAATVNGINVYYPRYPLLPKISDPLHAALMFAGVALPSLRRLRSHSSDLICTHWVYPDGTCSRWISRLAGLPITVTALGSDINRDQHHRLLRFQIKRTLEKATHLFAVSKALREEMIKLGAPADSTDYIPNGVDFNKFSPLDRSDSKIALGLDQRPLILAIGRLVDVKDHATLITAISRLPAQHRDQVQVAIIGDGPLHSSLNQQINRLGLQDQITLTGKIAHRDLPTWIGAAHQLCLPSKNEGQPNVLLEAIAAGRPVVASATGGIMEIVTPGNGLLFPVGDSQALAAAICQCLEQDWQTAAIQETIAERTFEHMAEQYLTIFNALLSAESGRP